jgi:hypothetical protein
MRAPTITAVAITIAALAAGCGGGSKHSATTSPSGTSTSSHVVTEAALTRAVRAALNENFRLSVYVLWHNQLPGWARHSTHGPALASLRASASTRQRRGIRVRSASGRYTIVSVRLDPSYTRASAFVRDKGRVFPYRGGKRLGRAIAVDDRARVELRRIGDTMQFVVWRISPIR